MNATSPWPEPIRRHRLSVVDYHRMAEAGVLGPEARVELIEGEIVDLPAIGSSHVGVVNRIAQRLAVLTIDRAVVSVQNPIVLGQRSEPEPDIALLAFREDYYGGSLPNAEDALLLIEVADTTLRYDREIKVPLTPSRFPNARLDLSGLFG